MSRFSGNADRSGLAALATFGMIGLLCVLVFMPLAVLWALNQLVGCRFAFDFPNWLAMFILMLTFGRSTGRKA